MELKGGFHTHARTQHATHTHMCIHRGTKHSKRLTGTQRADSKGSQHGVKPNNLMRKYMCIHMCIQVHVCVILKESKADLRGRCCTYTHTHTHTRTASHFLAHKEQAVYMDWWTHLPGMNIPIVWLVLIGLDPGKTVIL